MSPLVSLAVAVAVAAVVLWPHVAVVVPAAAGLAVVLLAAATRSLRRASRHIDRVLDEELASAAGLPAAPRQPSRAA